MTDSNDGFLRVLHDSLETKSVEPVRQYLSSSEKEDVAACAFEALRPIHKSMQSLPNDDTFYTECMEWLSHLVSIGTPKEILIGLLEIIGEEGSLVNCVHLIPMLQNTLVKLPGKRISSLEWTLSVLDKYIQQLTVPKDHQYEGEERKLLDLDPDVITVTEVLSPYITLLKTFVTEVSFTVCSKHKVEQRVILQRQVLIRYLLSVIGHPLAFMDLDQKSSTSRSKLQLLAADCVFALYSMTGYLYRIYQFASEDDDIGKNPTTDLALAVLAYLTMSENVSNFCPSVYNPWFMMETHLKYSVLLLSRVETLLVYKGLLLTSTLLDKFSSGALSVENLDFSDLLTLCDKLFNVMIHCPAKELRQSALVSFKGLVDKFDMPGTCRLLIMLLEGHSNPMVQSLLLNIYKDKLHKSLDKTNVENPYLKKNLERVLKIATKLETSKVETDLIENSSRILSSLNFLRYVALKVKETDLGIHEWLKNMPSAFLEPLRLALNLSRAHYKKQLEDIKIAKPQDSNLVANFMVGDESLPDLPPDYEFQICAAAITTFDLIESVMVRLEECLQL